MSFIKDHKKPRRDRIAREAEEAEARLERWSTQSEEAKRAKAVTDAQVDALVRFYFDFQTGGFYPCEGFLTNLLDKIRLAFFNLQKEIGIGGHRPGETNIPDDPQFGTQGDRQALNHEEREAEKAWQEGRGPKPHFLLKMPDDAP